MQFLLKALYSRLTIISLCVSSWMEAVCDVTHRSVNNNTHLYQYAPDERVLWGRWPSVVNCEHPPQPAAAGGVPPPGWRRGQHLAQIGRQRLASIGSWRHKFTHVLWRLRHSALRAPTHLSAVTHNTLRTSVQPKYRTTSKHEFINLIFLLRSN